MAALPVTWTDKTGRPFTLRALRPNDRSELEEMYADFEPKRVAQGLPPADPAQRRRWLDSVLADGHHVVVEIDGHVRGHGMLLPFDRTAAELANFLHQSVRDRGIGTALNEALLGIGRSHGIRRVWLSVEPSNRPAIRSYEKVGFRRRAVAAWSPEVEMEVTLEEE
ncbi:MAG: GNAT family N-acetyltransferase [Gemmatimonadetes bacterium]|nr:GNAT family N-acetyltransferase [Gemmatimonadota bacterium]NIQ53115.1 GNAT family N-acetyltransferase [Gemmatimonadota bacterium]NIU73261.1 GNAT family N-acetyltransferase [Gammaproteobacteria bacterium]NIX43524.1 GNAT family N-acetyltransferase [Gemmatimonadota bacterium]NIY07702.1 GNAT family N-acetyltransferase [Gemmatimonadota bacterium]